MSGRANCRCNEPSEGVHVTRRSASRRSWPPDVDHSLCYLELALVFIGRRVENGGILSPDAVASGERERYQHQECLDAVFVFAKLQPSSLTLA